MTYTEELEGKKRDCGVPDSPLQHHSHTKSLPMLPTLLLASYLPIPSHSNPLAIFNTSSIGFSKTSVICILSNIKLSWGSMW